MAAAVERPSRWAIVVEMDDSRSAAGAAVYGQASLARMARQLPPVRLVRAHSLHSLMRCSREAAKRRVRERLTNGRV